MDTLTQYVIYEKIFNDNNAFNIKIRYLCNDVNDAEQKFNTLKEIIPNIFMDITTVTKEVNIKIPPFITQTQKICLKCNQKFTYERKDEDEKFYRQFASLKKGNLDLCFDCDELDEKLSGSKSFGRW